MLLIGIVPAFPAQRQRFRGPNGAGIADAQSLPSEVRPDTNVAWKVALPAGFSSPIVSDTSVFVTASEDNRLYTISLDRQTGKINWKAEAPRTVITKPAGPNSPVSPSPVTDGNNVYVFFDSFGLLSYDSTGKERWRYEIGAVNLPYGAGTSPILAGSIVLLQMDQDTGSY